MFTTSGGGRGVGRLRGTDKLVASSFGLLGRLLGGGISVLLQVFFQVLSRHVVEGPGSPATGSLVVVLADERAELIGLGRMRDRNATGIEIGLEASLGPGVDCLVESILDGQRSVVGRLGVLVAGLGGSSTERRSGRGRGGVTKELSAVLADKRAELVQLGALGDYADVRKCCTGELMSLVSTYRECCSCRRTP